MFDSHIAVRGISQTDRSGAIGAEAGCGDATVVGDGAGTFLESQSEGAEPVARAADRP